MGMTKDQFKILVKAMKAVYTNPGFIPDNDAFDVWYSMLKDLDYALASRSVQMHMQTEETPPTVAGIRKQSAKLKADETDDLNETAAWSLVLKAIRRSTYYSDEEFAKLPPVVQRAVSSPRQLREWATLEDVDGKTLTVIQSNFQRTFRAEQQKERERNKLSPDVLKLMRTLNNPQIEDKPKELSIEEQRMISEENAKPAPDDFRSKLYSIFGEEGYHG